VVKLWDVTSTRRDPIRSIAVDTQEVWSLASSPDGQRLAIGCTDGNIKVWDCGADRPEPVLAWERKGHRGNVLGLAYSPDGRRVASAGADGLINLWDAQTGKPGPSFSGLDRSDSVAFSPDGGHLVAAFGDGTIKVWDVGSDSPESILVLYGHTSRVLSVAFSPDGRRLASAGFDGTARVWDTTSWPRPHGKPTSAAGR
jgi:WD40 repeat protein